VEEKILRNVEEGSIGRKEGNQPTNKIRSKEIENEAKKHYQKLFEYILN